MGALREPQGSPKVALMEPHGSLKGAPMKPRVAPRVSEREIERVGDRGRFDTDGRTEQNGTLVVPELATFGV